MAVLDVRGSLREGLLSRWKSEERTLARSKAAAEQSCEVHWFLGHFFSKAVILALGLFVEWPSKSLLLCF